MFNYIFLVLVLCMPSIASAKGKVKTVLVNKPGSCVIEDTWHPVTGEKLGKRERCGI